MYGPQWDRQWCGYLGMYTRPWAHICSSIHGEGGSEMDFKMIYTALLSPDPACWYPHPYDLHPTPADHVQGLGDPHCGCRGVLQVSYSNILALYKVFFRVFDPVRAACTLQDYHQVSIKATSTVQSSTCSTWGGRSHDLNKIWSTRWCEIGVWDYCHNPNHNTT